MRIRVVYIFILLHILAKAQLDCPQEFFYNLNPPILNAPLDSVSSVNISFAFSLRKLKKEYKGWCIRVRRSSDNTERNIGFNGDGLVDTIGINNFAGASTVFVTIWYDQSGLGRNAVQTAQTKQPILIQKARKQLPVIKFDGVNDILVVQTSVQTLTNAGVNGSVFYVGNSTRRAQWTFGNTISTSYANRWSVHISWSEDNVYFDPGICCNATRSFNNVARRDSFDQYSFIRTNTNVIIRQNSVQKINGAHTTGRCTNTNFFGIGAAWDGTAEFEPSDNSFHEIIMYRTDVSTTIRDVLELNQNKYWKI